MVRLQLTEKATKLVEKLTQEFRMRQIPKQDWTKIFSEALLTTSQEFWDTQSEKYTPQSYILELAMKDPKLQKEIGEFLRSRIKDSTTSINKNQNEAKEIQ